MLKVILLASAFQGILGAVLLELGKQPRTAINCCIKSAACTPTTINVEALGDENLELPYGINATFSNMIPGNVAGYHYIGDNADVIITYNEKTNGLHGHVTTMDGRSFVIENCGTSGHVFQELDPSDIGSDYAITEDYSGDTHGPIPRSIPLEDNRQSKPTYSIFFYYTPEFKAKTPEIDGYLDEILAETNQGYMNSGVDLIATKFCAEEATIGDGTNSYATLDRFKTMKGDIKTLRGTADFAVLLTYDKKEGICGLGSFNVVSSGNTVSLVAKTCSQFSLGHEIGHNIGLHHDPATSTNTAFPYGHGHLIAQGSYPFGLLSIMAYPAPNHWTIVNYYSNPNIIHPWTGTPTGVAGTSNNARLLKEKAIASAAIGDESGTCAATTLPSTTTLSPTTTLQLTTTVQGVNCGEQKKKLVLSWAKRYVGSRYACYRLCYYDSNCKYSIWLNSRRQCGFYKTSLKKC